MNPKILIAVGVVMIVIGYHDMFPSSDGTFKPWFFGGDATVPFFVAAVGGLLIGKGIS